MTKYWALGASALLVGVDQLIKYWAQTVLSTLQSLAVIPNLFYLTYVRNYGAAFGILNGKTSLLTGMVCIVLVAALYLLLTDKIKNPFMVWSVCLVIAGGAGNLIDRVMNGYVVDYLDFSSLFGFPVFNLADCCVVVGTFLILIYILFLDQPPKDVQPEAAETQPEEPDNIEEA